MLLRALSVLFCSSLLCGGLASVAAADTVVADNGFRPDSNGFSFENYGNDVPYQNLTAAEMVKLFGKNVCENHAKRFISEPAPAPTEPNGQPIPSNKKPPSGGKPSRPSDGETSSTDRAGDAAAGGCSLTPPAQQWMDTQNKSMNGGHCNGFAVLSEQLYKQQFPAIGSGKPFSYQISNNNELQHSIAYTFVYQVLDSVVSKRIKGTPNEILSTLATSLRSSNPETYTLGIYKPDGSGGHAITPFAVVRHTNSTYGVLVYDNNYPGKSREVEFDTARNIWSYNAAINPSVAPELYAGSAGNPGIELDPTTPGEGVQPCPFCKGSNESSDTRSGSGAAAAAGSGAATLDTVQLTGNVHYHAHLVISDRSGHRVGVVNGRIENTFPGAQVQPALAFNDYTESQEPAYLIPARHVRISIDGSRLGHADTETLSAVGVGQDVAIQNLRIAPGQRHALDFSGGVQQMAFTSAKGQGSGSPLLRIGADGRKADVALKLKLVSFHPGATLHVKINRVKQLITFWSTGNPGRATYVLDAIKETRTADYRLGSATVHLSGASAATYSYVK